MREKRHVGNLQGAEQLNPRQQQPAPAGAPATLTAAAGDATRGLVVGGLPMTETRTTPCGAFERLPVATSGWTQNATTASSAICPGKNARRVPEVLSLARAKAQETRRRSSSRSKAARNRRSRRCALTGAHS